MTITVKTRTGEAVQLADTLLGKGGEANVYAVPQYPNVVVKLYHDDVLKKRARDLQPKIDAMATDSKFAKIKANTNLAWPQFSVLDEKGNWRGFAMRKAESSMVSMNLLAHAKAYKDKFPHLDRSALANYAIDLLSTVQQLHKSGILIGDYNLANFLCDPHSSKVIFLDCDSWQLESKGLRFFCAVNMQDMMPPELIDKDFTKVPRTIESEYFSLAIVLFKMLMLGRHPYDIRGGESPVDNIKKGNFPYGVKGGSGIPVGPWFNIWSHLPFKIKDGFIKTFNEGIANKTIRTNTLAWREFFVIYQRELMKGFHNQELNPAKPKSKDYKGERKMT